MQFTDKNQTHEPPEGYRCWGVFPNGAFLGVQYRQDVYRNNTTVVIAQNIIDVFLNDMGREVARTRIRVEVPPSVPATVPPHVARRFKIWNGILLMLQGLQEMIR